MRIQLGGIRWEKMQNDVGRDLKFLDLMIAGTIPEQQDELPGVLLGQCLQEN
jgi:hypothetical protein